MIIADTGPIIAFARLGELNLLTQLFDQVILPSAVKDECISGLSKPGAVVIQQAIHSGALTVQSINQLGEQQALFERLSLLLDPGEAEAIMLAKQYNETLLIDEKQGRKVANQYELQYIGTCGVFYLAKQLGKISQIKDYFSKLNDIGYHISRKIQLQVLKLAGE